MCFMGALNIVCVCARVCVLLSSRGQTLSVSYIRLASLLLVHATIFFLTLGHCDELNKYRGSVRVTLKGHI